MTMRLCPDDRKRFELISALRRQFSRQYRRLFGAPPGRDAPQLLRTSLNASQV